MSAIVNNELIYKEKDLPLGSTRQMAQFESIKGTMIGITSNHKYTKFTKRIFRYSRCFCKI